MLYRENGQFKTTYHADQQIFPILQDRVVVIAFLVFAFVGVPMLASDYLFLSLIIPFLILSLAAIGLNVLVGYCGQISLGTAAFMSVGAYAAYLWRLEHLGHNWNLIMAMPVRPLDLFTAKFVVVAKLALLTHGYVFALFVVCGKLFAHLPGFPPATLPLYLLRGALGALAVIAAQLVLAMVIRSFAVPIFLALLGGISGMLAGSKGLSLFWPYCLMQMGMNANKQEDVLSGAYLPFFVSCLLWLAALFLLAWLLLRKRDVKA